MWISLSVWIISQAWGEAPCVTVAVGPEETCDKLHVTFDTGSCPKKTGTHAAKIRCKGTSATATSHIGEEVFTQKLKLVKGEGAWGSTGDAWQADGPVAVKKYMKRIPAAARPTAAQIAAEQRQVLAPEKLPEPIFVTIETPKTEPGPQPSVTIQGAPTSIPVIEVPKPAPIPLASPLASPSASPVVESPDTTRTTLAIQATTPPPTLQFSTYADLYYVYNFNQPASIIGRSSVAPIHHMLPSSQNGLRFYDWYHQQWGLNLIELTVKGVKKDLSFIADFDFGTFADANAQYTGTGVTGGPFTSVVDEVSKHIGQAVISFAPSAIPGLVIEGGKLASHVGLELMKPKDNPNYSRSLTFSYGVPFWHTGVHVGYTPVAGKLTLNGYWYNGWNTMYKINASTTLGFQGKWTPNDQLVLIYNWIGGPEQQDNTQNLKQVHDFNVTWTASPAVQVAFDVLQGSEQGILRADGTNGIGVWTAWELYSKWSISPHWSITPRVEGFYDPQGWAMGGVGGNTHSATMTLSSVLTEGLEARFELRYDLSTQAARFESSKGPTSSQPSATLAFLMAM